MTIYRVQDSDGRGPWKPGFSQAWLDARSDAEWEAREKALPAAFNQFGMKVLMKALLGAHMGTGCTSLECLRKWFTPTEYRKLQKYGYRAVRMEVDRILAESDIQALFERVKPLNRDVEPVYLYEEIVKCQKEST